MFWKNASIVSVAAIIIIASASFFVWKSNQPGEFDEFAKCLTEKGFSMGGTEWCPVCRNQKNKFGKSFKHVDYQNCDTNKQWCLSNGVTQYPTWIMPDGDKVVGIQELHELGSMSGCSLPA